MEKIKLSLNLENKIYWAWIWILEVHKWKMRMPIRCTTCYCVNQFILCTTTLCSDFFSDCCTVQNAYRSHFPCFFSSLFPPTSSSPTLHYLLPPHFFLPSLVPLHLPRSTLSFPHSVFFIPLFSLPLLPFPLPLPLLLPLLL